MNSRFARLARLDPWTALRVFAVVLFLVPGRLTRVYRTEIMIALSLNAYFGSHVLLQVTLQRYAAAGILAAFFLATSFAFTTFYALRLLLAAASWLSRRTRGGPRWHGWPIVSNPLRARRQQV